MNLADQSSALQHPEGTSGKNTMNTKNYTISERNIVLLTRPKYLTWSHPRKTLRSHLTILATSRPNCFQRTADVYIASGHCAEVDHTANNEPDSIFVWNLCRDSEQNLIPPEMRDIDTTEFDAKQNDAELRPILTPTAPFHYIITYITQYDSNEPIILPLQSPEHRPP